MVGCYASSALFSTYQYPWLLLLPVKQKFFQHALISDIGFFFYYGDIQPQFEIISNVISLVRTIFTNGQITRLTNGTKKRRQIYRKINLGCYLMEQIYFVPLSNWCALS